MNADVQGRCQAAQPGTNLDPGKLLFFLIFPTFFVALHECMIANLQGSCQLAQAETSLGHAWVNI